MKSKYLDIRELVPPETYTDRSDKAWELIDPALIALLDRIWEKCGEFTVNNWHTGGQYKESGLRSFGTSTGSKFSQHKFGRAADLKPKGYSVPQFYDRIKIAGLGDLTVEDIEDTPTWVHVDVRNNQLAGIRVVKP